MLSTALPRVTDVEHLRDYVVRVTFADGVQAEVDLEDAIANGGAMLESLRAPAVFRQVSVLDGTLAWPDGMDWSPESLYARACAANGIIVQSEDDRSAAWRAQVDPIPEISRFLGIVIKMLADDHNPPHFRAVHGDYGISVTIRDGVVTGRFPRGALRLVLEWSEQHESELLANWDRMRRGEAPEPIAPLD
jgi:hypothetical protein